MEKKNFILLSILFCFVFLLASCGENSSSDTNLKNGQRLTLKEDTPVATSKDGVDKIIDYENQKNEKGLDDMEANGETTVLSKGTEVNVVDVGITTEVQTDDGTDYYAPEELFEK